MILVTGATGFIGSHLVKRLCDNFIAVVRYGDKYKFSRTFFVDGINSKTNWDNAFEDVSDVIHLAGLAHSKNSTKYEFNEINNLGTLRFAEAAARNGVRRFVFVSSIGVNGVSTKTAPFNEHQMPAPENAYAQSKYDAEVALMHIANTTNMEVVIIRPTLVYGAGAPGSFSLLINLIKNMPFLPFGLINNKKNFISVYNLVDLLITCVNHPSAANKIFLASEDDVISTRAFTNKIANGLNKKIIQVPIPPVLLNFILTLIGRSDVYKQLCCNLEVDSSALKEVLNWTPPYKIDESMAFLKEVK